MYRKINNKIKEYIKELQKYFSIEKSYLFGSYTTKKYVEGKSDIDLALFSKETDISQRHKLLKECFKLTAKYKLNIQPLIYDISEYINRENDFIREEIISKGIEI